jgi:PAS domain-containing protein
VCDLRLVKKDGSLFWVQLESTIAQDSETKDTQCYTVISNITESKLAEEALRKSEKSLAAIMNASTESILLMDLKRRLHTANKALAQHLEVDLKTLLQGNLYDFLSPNMAKIRKLQVK